MALTASERAALRTMVGSGSAPARMRARARMLRKADRGEGGTAWADAAIAAALEVHPTTVARVRRRCVEHGLTAALECQRPDRVSARRLDGRQEAHLVALACGEPPEGHARWSLRLLADEQARREAGMAVSHETVRPTLKTTTSSPG